VTGPAHATSRPTRPALGRLAFLGPGLAALVLGLWGGLGRVGLSVAAPPDLVATHGPLMVAGFLGTVIGVERAVALARPWGWIGPGLSAAGAILVAAGVPEGAYVAAAGAVGLVVVFGALSRRDPALHMGVMTTGAACFALGTAAWAGGASVPATVAWWEGFLVLTIAGERLELSRLSGLPRSARASLVVLVGAALLALVSVSFRPEPGARALGVIWIALAAWLGLYDIARRTIRRPGLPRFVAACLLAGYAWLGVAGAALLAWGPQAGGLRYDAQLHALFVGFVLSMILGHAPIVFPAVLRLAMPFRAFAWVPLALLHASLALRLAGDLVASAGARAAGGLGGVVALVLFLASTAASALSARRR
jgi:hypothetical protein